MNLFDRILRRVAPYFPRFKRAIENTEKRAAKLKDALDEQREDHKAFAEMARELQMRKNEAEERLQQVHELRVAEQLCRMSEREIISTVELQYGESAKDKGSVDKILKERLWELELALEDRGWVRETTLAALEFSRYGVQQLIRICRIYGIKNPIIKRISEICELYVFGRGIEIRSDDKAANEVIQDFLHANDAEMGHNGLALKEKDIQTDGSLYFGLETASSGDVRVIMIDPLEIMDVATDPDDCSKPLYFKRQWTRVELNISSGQSEMQMMYCWYPSLELVNDIAAKKATSANQAKPKRIGDVTVNWDMPILRDKIGAPAKWRWGVPPIYAAIDWARAYKDALEDYATVRRTLARFALMVETKGGPGAIAAYQALLSTTFADNDGTQIERNPPPNVGSAHIGGPGTDISAFKSAGAQASPDEARRILLMACASAGMPETFFGDASTGSLATAVSLDRPTELKFTAIQRRWRHTIKRILEYALYVSRVSPSGKMREAREADPAPQPVHISVEFPNVVEHEMLPMIQSIAEIATCGGRNGIPAGIVDRRLIAEMFLKEIGYGETDKRLDKIYGTDYKPQNDVTDQRSQPAPQSLTVPIGKALTALSTPPPLPVSPPAPIAAPDAVKPPVSGPPLVQPKPAPAKPGAKPATKKEAFAAAVAVLSARMSED